MTTNQVAAQHTPPASCGCRTLTVFKMWQPSQTVRTERPNRVTWHAWVLLLPERDAPNQTCKAVHADGCNIAGGLVPLSPHPTLQPAPNQVLGCIPQARASLVTKHLMFCPPPSKMSLHSNVHPGIEGPHAGQVSFEKGGATVGDA